MVYDKALLVYYYLISNVNNRSLYNFIM